MKVYLLAASLSLIAHSYADIDYCFEKWANEEAIKFKKSFLKENKTEKISVNIDNEIATILQKNNYYEAFRLQSKICSQEPENFNKWIKLGEYGLEILYLEKENKDYSKYHEWLNKTRYILINSYHLAKNDSEKVQALILYYFLLSKYENHEYYFDTAEAILSIIVTNFNLEKLKTLFPQYLEKISLSFLSQSMETYQNKNTICLTFSQKLDSTINVKDYIEISPKFEGSTNISGNKIYLTGGALGENYNVTIREGLPSIHGLKTLTSTKLGFKLPDLEPRLSFSTNKSYVFHRGEKLELPLSFINIDKIYGKIYKFSERNLLTLLKLLDSRYYDNPDYNLRNNGSLIFEGQMDLRKNMDQTNKEISTNIYLGDHVKDPESGLYAVFIESTEKSYNKPYDSQFFVISDLGISSYSAQNGLFVTIRSLSTADPLSNVKISLISKSNDILFETKTNEKGQAHIEASYLRGIDGNAPYYLAALKDEKDFNYIRLNRPGLDLSDFKIEGKALQQDREAFIFSDRNIYKPGEVVPLSFLLRDRECKAISNTPLIIKVLSPDGKESIQKLLTTDELGYVNYDWQTLDSFRTGAWSVCVYLNAEDDPLTKFELKLEDFVPNRLVVNIQSALKELDPQSKNEITLNASYLFGAKASGLEGDAYLSVMNHPKPFADFESYCFGFVNTKITQDKTLLGHFTLDANGQAQLSFDFPFKEEFHVPLLATIEAQVIEAEGRPQKGKLILPVFTQPYYIGLKIEEGKNEKTQNVHIVGIKPDQTPVKGTKLLYKLINEEINYVWSKKSQYDNWEYIRQVGDIFVLDGEITLNDKGEAILPLTLEEWGTFRIEVTDPQTHAVSSMKMSHGFFEKSDKGLSPSQIKVMLDKESYQAGEEAKLIVQSPFEGKGSIVIAHHDVLRVQDVDLKTGDNIFSIKTDEKWKRGAYAMISAIRPLGVRLKPEKMSSVDLMPKRASGIVWIPLDQSSKKLDLKLDLPQEIKPKTTLTVPVETNAKKGEKIGIWVAVVDEGIHNITDFKTPNPFEFFTEKTRLDVVWRDIYGKIIDPMPGETDTFKTGSDADLFARRMADFSKKKKKLLAFVKKTIEVDDNGKALIDFEMPDYDGKVHVMALGYSLDRVGCAEGFVTIRSDIVMESTTPRFLKEGDKAKLFVDFYPFKADFGQYLLKIMGDEFISSDAKYLITLQKDVNAKAQFDIQALKQGEGVINLQLEAEQKDSNEKNELSIQKKIEIPIHPLYDYRYTYSIEALEPKKQFTLSFKELKIQNEPTLKLSFSYKFPWSIDNAYKAANSFPYGCSEQIIAQGFAQIWTFLQNNKDQATSFSLNKIISLMAERQNSQGGWGRFNYTFTPEANVVLTCFGAEMLGIIEKQGFSLPTFVKEKMNDYLESIVKSIKYSKENLDEKALALALVANSDAFDAHTFRYIGEEKSQYFTLPTSFASLAYALAQKGEWDKAHTYYKKAIEFLKNIKDEIVLERFTPLLQHIYVLDKLMAVAKQMPNLHQDLSDLIIKVSYLVSKKPYLTNLEGALLLKASSTLVKEARQEPKMDFKVTDPQKVHENPKVLEYQTNDLPDTIEIKNAGDSPLFIEIGQGKRNQSFDIHTSDKRELKRTFLNADGQEIDVREIKQGEVITVVVEGALHQGSEGMLFYVDPLPAGLEVEDTTLLKQNDQSQNAKLKDFIKPEWFEFKDSKVIVAFMKKEPGNFKFAYRLRAVTQGEFQALPARLEDMLYPEQTIHHALDMKSKEPARVVIKEK